MDRGIDFSKHALERIAERGASREFIETAVTGGVKTARYTSSKDPNIRFLTAKDGEDKYWTVIYHERIITVRRARKSEEKLYDKMFR